MLSRDQVHGFVGASAYDRDGIKIGKILAVIDDDATDQPRWIAVRTGALRAGRSLVPLQGAQTSGGGNLIVAHTKVRVEQAPPPAAAGTVSADDEQRLLRHYGLRPGRG